MEDSRQGLVNSVDYVFQDVNKDPPTDVPVNTQIIDCDVERVPEFVALCAFRDERKCHLSSQ